MAPVTLERRRARTGHRHGGGNDVDGQRFDALARRLAGRLPRRAVLARGGAGLALLTLAAQAGRRAAAQDQGQPPVCTDPDRPGVGCACATGTQNPCGDTTLLCCKNDPDGPPGSPGTCTPASVGCDPLGPPETPTPTPTTPCTGRGCRCHGDVAGACDGDLACCPDNPGLPGGPGRCVRPNRCNLGPCTGEGCDCHAGVEDACDGGLVCCADDSSQPGGPGRCEAEAACFANQCQATTNPCPSACAAGANCADCCSGYCGDDGHCAAAPCTGQGCECTTGTESPCDDGLVCCAAGGPPGGPGTCIIEAQCEGAGGLRAEEATPVA
jgi:hypothetical protein